MSWFLRGRVTQIWVRIATLPLTRCKNLGKWLKLSDSQLPHLYNLFIYSIILCWKLTIWQSVLDAVDTVSAFIEYVKLFNYSWHRGEITSMMHRWFMGCGEKVFKVLFEFIFYLIFFSIYTVHFIVFMTNLEWNVYYKLYSYIILISNIFKH